METEHTPCPWEISKVGNNYDHWIVYSEKETIVNTVYGEANANKKATE